MTNKKAGHSHVTTRRFERVSRVIAALVGGYVLSSLVAVCLAVALPMARSEAVLIGIMASFVVYVCAVLWVFSTSSARRAWLGLLGSSGLLMVISYYFL